MAITLQWIIFDSDGSLNIKLAMYTLDVSPQDGERHRQVDRHDRIQGLPRYPKVIADSKADVLHHLVGTEKQLLASFPKLRERHVVG